MDVLPAHLLVHHVVRCERLAYADVRALAQTCKSMRRAIGAADEHKTWRHHARWLPRIHDKLDEFMRYVSDASTACIATANNNNNNNNNNDVEFNRPRECTLTINSGVSVQVRITENLLMLHCKMLCIDVGSIFVSYTAYSHIARNRPRWCRISNSSGFANARQGSSYVIGGHVSPLLLDDDTDLVSRDMTSFVDVIREWLRVAMYACLHCTATSRRDVYVSRIATTPTTTSR